LGALFHDICAVVDRENHEIAGSGLARALVRKNPRAFGGADPAEVADIVELHNQRPEPAHWPKEAKGEAKLVRDADTLHEGIDLQRIVWVGEQRRRTFYSPQCGTLEERLSVLESEDRKVTEAEKWDVLMFLLRNVTKSINPRWFVTDEARAYIKNEDIEGTNQTELANLIETYVRNQEDRESAVALVKTVTTEYRRTHAEDFRDAGG
jgi:hypothetical protein